MSDKEQLDRIEAKLDSLLLLISGRTTPIVAARPVAAAPAQRAASGAAAVVAAANGQPADPSAGLPVASDDDLDGRYGNPEIRRDPPRWRGESMVGRKFSDCPPEYLDTLAGFFDWRADQDDKKGDPRSKWSRLDAGRARGWARRIRNGGAPVEAAPAPAAAAPSYTGEPDADPYGSVDDVPFLSGYDRGEGSRALAPRSARCRLS